MRRRLVIDDPKNSRPSSRARRRQETRDPAHAASPITPRGQGKLAGRLLMICYNTTVPPGRSASRPAHPTTRAVSVLTAAGASPSPRSTAAIRGVQPRISLPSSSTLAPSAVLRASISVNACTALPKARASNEPSGRSNSLAATAALQKKSANPRKLRLWLKTQRQPLQPRRAR